MAVHRQFVLSHFLDVGRTRLIIVIVFLILVARITTTTTTTTIVVIASDLDEYKVKGRLLLYNIAPGIRNVTLTSDGRDCLEDLAEVHTRMNCSANVTDFSGWWSPEGIVEVHLFGWFDEGNDDPYVSDDFEIDDDYELHNQSYPGANFNFHFSFYPHENKFVLNWPLTGEITLNETECGYYQYDEYTVRIWFIFEFGNQTKHAAGDYYWTPGPGFNDANSWNFKFAAIDGEGFIGWRDYEFGIYRYTSGKVGNPYPTAISGTILERVYTDTFWLLEVSNDDYNLNVTLASDLIAIEIPDMYIGASNVSFNCTIPQPGIQNVTGIDGGWTAPCRPAIPAPRFGTYQITYGWRYEIFIPWGVMGGNYYADLIYTVDQIT